MKRHDTGPPVRVLVVGPTSASWASIAAEVQADLERLARPGVELTYRCTGAGPVSIRTEDDARDAAPYVVRTVLDATREGFDAVIVDCTDDPGVAQAREQADIAVVGAGEALRDALADASQPVLHLTGDVLRASDEASLVDRARTVATVALHATGCSHLADRLAVGVPGVVVLDPLPLALDRCLALLETRTSRARLDSGRDPKWRDGCGP